MNILDKRARYEIVEAIRHAEASTRGEIRVHVQNRCGEDAMKEARKVFRRLGMHRTREHNAVLIFVAHQSRRFAIFGDKGMHGRVGDVFWNAARDKIQGHFLKNDIVGGIVAGVKSVGEKLKEHFSAGADDTDELPDRVSGGRA